MGKIAQLEDDVITHFEGLISSGVASEVGLLVGQFGGSSRDLVFGVAPCPPRNNARSAIVTISNFTPDAAKGKKGPQRPTITARLDVEWIGEHGAQVERMLPGGIQIVGLYVFVPESGYQSCVGEACSVLAELRNAGIFRSEDDALILHVDEGAKKQVMRSCSAAATTAADLKPVEMKFGPGLKNLVCLRTVYNVDICLPTNSDCDSLQRHIDDIVAAESDQIKSCHVFHEGRFVESSSILTDLLPKGATAAEPWNVQLYRPISAACKPQPANSTGSTQVIGRGRIQGTMEGRVYCNKRLTFEKAVADLKEDLCHSLRARVDLVVEDAERWTEQKEEEYDNKPDAPQHPLLSKSQLGSQAHHSLPFRVFVPWKSGVTVCDYLMPGETLENTQARVKDMLAIHEMDGEEVATAERLDDAPAARSSRVNACEVSWLAKKWDPHRIHAAVQKSQATSQSVNLKLILTILVALIALLIPIFQFIR